MFVYRLITFQMLCVVYKAVGQHDTEGHFGDIVKKTLVATAHTCMDHVDATVKDLEQLREEPPYPEKSACIMKCLLEKIAVVKNNKYSKTGFMTAVTPLVFTNKKKFEHMKSVSENCDKEKYWNWYLLLSINVLLPGGTNFALTSKSQTRDAMPTRERGRHMHL